MFDVEPSRGRWPDWALVADEIDAALRGTLALDERLAEQANAYAEERRAVVTAPCRHRRHRRRRRLGDLDGDRDPSPRLGRPAPPRSPPALFACDLDVVAARVSTSGHEVVDAFYVRDRSSEGKITDPERIRRIEEEVRRAIAADTFER